jgi:hypothetical protein
MHKYDTVLNHCTIHKIFGVHLRSIPFHPIKQSDNQKRRGKRKKIAKIDRRIIG